MLYKHYMEMKSSETKHLHMRVFHKNKDGRSKDQNINEFNSMSPALKSNVNIFFFHGETNFHFMSPVSAL